MRSLRDLCACDIQDGKEFVCMQGKIMELFCFSRDTTGTRSYAQTHRRNREVVRMRTAGIEELCACTLGSGEVVGMRTTKIEKLCEGALQE